jgi:hypothetical protein
MIGRSWCLSSPTRAVLTSSGSCHITSATPRLVTILPAHFHHCLLAALSVIPHVNLRGSGWFALRLQQYSNSPFHHSFDSGIHRVDETEIDLCHDVIVTASSFLHPYLFSLPCPSSRNNPTQPCGSRTSPAHPNLARSGGNFHALSTFSRQLGNLVGIPVWH